ncbi:MULTISPECIES: S9 family peptidase [Micromonospora]|uniref:Alpha/beta fold hydrolase n=1 Tax=Micromonospora solifontis TaxID=2487138 RepID=A0ABX9W9R0_9ACTN|nr:MULTISPECIES: alpha/beta fold hydrolase [Micromonospora]NES13740.1 alpha/beta fold hydrolase [Micromonospora sp. PPF5-17B]NES39218.1 alpha/beta fold hydrolase [Micromonospora solifontis]NES55293.1 alpha/beta fold hydrolase [Micromonospora sp. PPF5-6]RNL89918.1 alpha/beta fold hydrolase [Micromonospora solifontis]
MTAERELSFDSAGNRLVGTLTVPAGPGPHPAALLLPGSGPLNRDGDHRRLRLGIQRDLAAALTAAGIATLRHDRRGVGDSAGRFLRTGFHDNVADAQAALAALGAADEVDAGKLFLVGHSEGALTATALAARGVPVAGLVLLAGTGRPGAEVLRWQAARLLPTLPPPVRLLLRLTRTDLVAKVARNHQKILASTDDVAWIGGQRMNAKWMREFLRYDPRPDLARIQAPILALTGAKDLQTDPDDLPIIADHAGGPVEIQVLPDVTHVLRRQPGPPSLGAYRREVREPVDRSVTEPVIRWLTARLAELRRV